MEMALGLLEDESYRAEADAAILEMMRGDSAVGKSGSDKLSKVAKDELQYAKDLWEGYYLGAYEAARRVADSLGGDELGGYRAWWWYMASVAAELAGKEENASDCRRRAIRCGIHQAFVQGLPAIGAGSISEDTGSIVTNALGVWDFIEEEIGWAGEGLTRFGDVLTKEINDDRATQFHMGLEKLGQLLGAECTRSKETGAPDVVWTFEDDIHLAFEAKSEKQDGGRLSKKEVQQANGHVKWVEQKLAANPETCVPHAVAVSPTRETYEDAKVHIDELSVISPTEVREFSELALEALAEVRASFSGREYAEAMHEVHMMLQDKGLDEESVVTMFTSAKLDAHV